MIARLDHVNSLFKSDNASVYSMIEETARGIVYAPTIKPYARKKDGRAAWKAMVFFHAGQDNLNSSRKKS